MSDGVSIPSCGEEVTRKEIRNVDGQEMSEHDVPYFRNLLGMLAFR